jgi:GTP-binding protein
MEEAAKTLDLDALPIIALVGRVNVGKSTLFNTLIEEQKAIVSDIPGTTRTSNVGIVLWRGKYMRVIDTGGLTFTDDIPLEEDILKQTEHALKDADIILFITDAKDGVLPQERELAKRLRRVEVKPVLLIANKVDNKKIEQTLTEEQWFKLGLGEPYPISATNGRNVGDLLDKIYATLHAGKRRPKTKSPQDKPSLRVSIIGKPNAGKSSLFNKLIGEERVIVNDMAHTTREPYDTRVVYTQKGTKKKNNITFVDTAGIRRKASVSGILERLGIHKSIQAIEHSEIILFVLDGSQPITSQDMQLGGLVERRGKSVIIILNKWDLAEDTSDTVRNDIKKMVYAHFPHLKFAPIIFTSGLTGTGVHTIFPMILRVFEARQTEIPPSALSVFLKKATREHRPSRGKGTRHPKLLGMKQLGSAPPVFQVYVKYRTSLHRSYVHYLENRLREHFDFFGTPIIIKLKKMKK